MNTTTKWILGLVAINIALLPFSVPAIGKSVGGASKGWLDCCRETAAGDSYCCVDCCWLTHDCIPGRGCGRAAAEVSTPPNNLDDEPHDR